MRKVDFNRKMMSSILVIVLAFCIFSPALAGGQQGGMGMMSSGMMGEGGQAQMMGQRMMGPGMMPMMRMEGLERMGLRKMGITGMLHRWGSYFFTRKDQLGLTEDQLDKIESILNSHIKYAIRKNADRKILLMEIQELLVKDKVDLGGVEEKLKAMEALNTDMNMEGVRTLEEALTVLTPEQRKKVKALFKGSTFFRAMSMGPSPGGMMGGCMMKGMMARGGAMAETKTAQASLTRTDSQGPVTVVVTYQPSTEGWRR
jgi:Spy/CpxP family protein refolding chaperone